MKRYVLIAGVNGAGKSTLYQALDSLHDMERINTDEIVRAFGNWKNVSDVFRAGKIAVKKINGLFDSMVSFNQETTLCGNTIINNINKAKELGYQIEVHYVGVDTVDIAKKRIAYRVSQGGHGIPDSDVERRYIESFSNLKRILSICDLVVMYDNTEDFKRFAIYENGELKRISDSVPKWYIEYLE